MNETLARFFLVFSSLFVIVDPFSTVPLLLGLTKDRTNTEIKATILRACLFSSITLAVFAIGGAAVLGWLRINLDAFRAAGGLLLLLTALEMLRGGKSQMEGTGLSDHNANNSEPGLVPLGIPSLAGPGAITAVIVFSTDHTQSHVRESFVLLGAIALAMSLTFIILRLSAHAKRWLGPSGLVVLEKIMGLFLAALSLQFLLEGSARLVAQHLR